VNIIGARIISSFLMFMFKVIFINVFLVNEQNSKRPRARKGKIEEQKKKEEEAH
jgi:hypothetical protein